MMPDQPQRDPIEAATRKLIDMMSDCRWLIFCDEGPTCTRDMDAGRAYACKHGVNGPCRDREPVKNESVREILTQHFGSALRARRAIDLLESKTIVLKETCRRDGTSWRARMPHWANDWVYDSTIVGAVLEAAGEKS